MKLTKHTLTQLIREEMEKIDLKSRSISKNAQAAQKKAGAQDIGAGRSLGNVSGQERAILQDIEAALTKIADEGDLLKFKVELERFLNKMLKSA